MCGSAQPHFPFGREVNILKPAPSLATKFSLFGQTSWDFDAALMNDKEALTNLEKF